MMHCMFTNKHLTSDKILHIKCVFIWNKLVNGSEIIFLSLLHFYVPFGCSPKKMKEIVGVEQQNDDDKYLNKKQEFPPNKWH